jgi:radical SAM protein with 4Fe4S-binding SPASM domain
MYLRDGSRKRTALRPNVPKLTPDLDMEPHPFEGYLNHPVTRKILLKLTSGPNGHTPMENIFYSYRDPGAPTLHKIRYMPFHMALDYFVARTGIPRERAINKVFHHQPTVRTLVNTARSIAVRGLVAPQRFLAPLLVVWNITNACNLACKHCYQNATARRSKDELSRAEKIAVIDQLSDNYVPMVAIAGGEPLTDPDLWAVLERAQEKKVYVTIATNGTLLTRRNVDRIASFGVKYIEVSLDSSDPSTHDAFRGVPGAWARTVEGIENVVAHPDLRCGMAVCFTRETVKSATEMMDLAASLKVDTFVHFNFIPVGRGIEMASEDMLPEQREELLTRLMKFLEEGKAGVMSTAPQFGRTCMMFGDPDSMMAMGHAGSGKGRQARVVAKYIGGCGAFRCYCSLQPNGIVTPCVYMPSRIIGDLRKSSFAEIWDQPLEAAFSDREDRGDHCGVCDYRSFCGGCRARADGYTGDMLAGDPGCVYNRHMWDEITAQQASAQEILCSLTTAAEELEKRGEVGETILT